MANDVKCARCGKKQPALPKPPFSNQLGQRIHQEICEPCWKAWLAAQNQLINHYGLSTIKPEHQQFLIENMESFLFGGGLKEKIDTTLEGKVSY